jgi:hypothetical protein
VAARPLYMTVRELPSLQLEATRWPERPGTGRGAALTVTATLQAARHSQGGHSVEQTPAGALDRFGRVEWKCSLCWSPG